MSDGWKKLDKALAKLEAQGNDPQYVTEAGNYVLAAAKLLCSGFILTSGELRNSLGMTVQQESDGVSAHVGTNKAYAPYVEFGTGPKGAANHQGTSPEIEAVYSLTPWWIHESQIDKAAAQIYGWSSIDTENGRFYKCSGQPAHPYLYPALNDNKDEVIKILAKGLEEAVKG